MKIEISDVAKEVLKSFGRLSEAHRISSELLYARDNNQGGTGLQGIFYPCEGSIVCEEFGIRTASSFLSVLGMVKDAEIELENQVIVVKGNGKKLSYNTTPVEMIPELPTIGRELYESSTDVEFSMVIDEVTLTELRSVVKSLDLDELKIVVDDNGKVHLRGTNTSTGDSMNFDVEGSGSDVFEYKFGSIKVIDLMYDGVYAVQCRKIQAPDGSEKSVAKFVNKSFDKKEHGELFYFYALN